MRRREIHRHPLVEWHAACYEGAVLSAGAENRGGIRVAGDTELSERNFRRFRELIYEHSRI
ncbi:MAG: hypothetical protein ACOCX4_02840, partial [Planctomycetota bacterium]